MKRAEVISSNEYSITWRSPANIALVKYWGKKEGQLPCNPSLSFTLEGSYSQTRLGVNNNKGCIEFYYGDRHKDSFLPKIKTFFSRVAPPLPPSLGERFLYPLRQFLSPFRRACIKCLFFQLPCLVFDELPERVP